jgi:hypothetical protein
VSSYLLFLVAALQVVSSILAFAYIGDMQAVYDDAFSEVESGDTVAGVTGGILIGVTIFSLLVGAGLVVLAIFNNRGKNASRIVTWVVGGIFLCCGGSGLAGQVGGGFNFGGPQDPNVPTNDELQQMLSDVLPSWYQAVTIVISVIGVLALLVALILLALPPSNEFFRKRQPEWQPPVGGGPGYQAYPAYPTTPPPAGPGTAPGGPGTAPGGPGTAPGGPGTGSAASDPTAPPSPPDERPSA